MKHVNTDPGKPQKPTVIDQRGDTDDAEMITNDAYQQTMHETFDLEEGDDKPYPEIPAATYADPEKGEPNTQKRLCHNDVQDVPNMWTSMNVPDVKIVQDAIVQDAIMPNVPDMPRTTAHSISNTKSHQTNSWQTNPRQKIALSATTSERGSPRGHN